MIQDELALEVHFEAGQVVWWTHGLTYWVCTYKPGGKIRKESGELVRIEAVNEQVPHYSGHGISNRTVRVYSFEEQRDYLVHPCWLSLSENVPCDGVLEAYQ